jgi:hypothetical protein
MANLDDLAAAAQRAKTGPASPNRAGPEVASGAAWMILKNDTQLGPYSLGDIQRLVNIGSVNLETKAWCEGMAEWVPISRIVPMPAAKSSAASAATPNTVPYASPATNEPKKPGEGFITRYRRRVGHRSFIFQVWLSAWTVFYVIWMVSLWASASSHAPALPPGMAPFNPAPSPFSPEDLLAGATSGWLCVGAGWAVVGLPVGIAAVATMENNRT